MAPTRKSRSVNKRFTYPNEGSPTKDGDSANKSNKRKRKVSDMLGPQWSKEELQRFYEAYRKYGKDWKKVAVAVRNRSVEMVEALYTMNRAYLSLPEGTASVVGLIAMMTDHYSVLEGTDSEQESNDGVGVPRKPHKRTRGKLHPNTAKNISDVSHSQSVASSYGCLSLLKKRRSGGNQPRAVGKRTPRIPVRYTYDKDSIGRYISPVRQGLKSKLDADADDDDVAHEVALALAEASHRGSSPQVSQTPNKRREAVVKSPVGLGERVCSESEMTSANNIGNDMDDGCEGSLGSTEGENNFSLENLQPSGRKGVGTFVQQKAKKSYGKKVEVEDTGHHYGDDEKEACSGTEGGQKFSSFETKQTRDVTFTHSSGQAFKKRSKKVLFGGDEGVALDALQALADLSLMMPSSTAEAEPIVPLKEEKESDIDKFRQQDTISTSQRVKPKASPSKKKGDQSVLNTQVSVSRKSKPGKPSAPNSSPVADTKDSGMRKRKPKSSVSKNASAEAQMDSHANAVQEKEYSDKGMKSVNKSRHFPTNAFQQQLGQLVRISEHSSSSTDIRRDGDDSAVSSVQAPETIKINSLTKYRSRRKVDKSQIQRSDVFVNEKSNASGQLYHDKTVYLKERLCSCLSNYRVRRWCVSEWFYSAIDYPWFAKSEFVEYLYHVGLGHVPRLTRVEWGVIRSSLGKPRRFSEQFLKEEKEKLNYYRESVRSHYTELRMGRREGLPTDLARPLTVGQRVIAIHPRSREIHDGSVLTVDHNRCRVQFDRPELGVEFVEDIDCMPLNPSENMPTSLTRHNIAVDKFHEALKQFKASERSDDRVKEEIIKFTPSQKVENADGPSNVAPVFIMSNLSKQTKEGFVSPSSHEKVGHGETISPRQALISQQSALSQFQSKEADIRALAELTRALDKKNSLVTELKRMNDDVSEDNSLKDVDSFKKQYAAVLVQLNEVLDQVSSALMCLRQRNTYQGNSLVPWQTSKTSLEDHSSIVSSLNCLPCDSQRTVSHVCEIIDTSRIKARNMVDAALKAVSSLRLAAESVQKIEEAVDFVNNRLVVDYSSMPMQTNQINGSLTHHDQPSPCTLNMVASDQALNSRSNGASTPCEPQVPSELIAHCVATLLMIQKCTERQFPPAEVAQILDLAVTSLQPCCSQNIPIYTEIQKCMGIIRSQILALVPT
ncbi:protein ALWAYS EARLY 3 isoform X2 [Beta vulgaris subsp. vulgaris]|uniref:protein ALWAYS EARLY 3 isoform X2 n=1 Tax=Beta vulgaris subsp. vulgaris TaxID=3555 RepID=UPI0020369DB9|nr:protein ALWAYS EARLY 3 isoform X2 [Beta vulgaris subsp. vulgaris]